MSIHFSTISRHRLVLVPALALAALLAGPARAQETAKPEPTPAAEPEARSTLDKLGRIGSDSLGPFMLVSAAGIAAQDDYRWQRMGRSAEAIAATGALTMVLKKLVKEERPNKANQNSFPSGHASLSFATATLVDAYQPHYKGAAYAWATWISLSRVQVRAHYLHDAAAGALLGHFVTKAFTGKYRGSEGEDTPANAPAAVPQSWALRTNFAAAPQNDRWKVNLGMGGLALRKSW